jgi:DNA invertase Pin-like site-specific DNA recombinase
MRAGIYVRISRAADGSTLGVERQEPPCRALCERNGWEAAEVYSDNDLSAFNGHRPGYQRLLTDAKATMRSRPPRFNEPMTRRFALPPATLGP